MKTHEMTPRIAFFAYGIDGLFFFAKLFSKTAVARTRVQSVLAIVTLTAGL